MMAAARNACVPTLAVARIHAVICKFKERSHLLKMTPENEYLRTILSIRRETKHSVVNIWILCTSQFVVKKVAKNLKIS